MTAPHVESGGKVVVHGDPRVHVVAWSSFRSWEAACMGIGERWQPDYYAATHARSNTPLDTNDAALQLHAAPDDAIVTCVGCLAILLRHP